MSTWKMNKLMVSVNDTGCLRPCDSVRFSLRVSTEYSTIDDSALGDGGVTGVSIFRQDENTTMAGIRFPSSEDKW